MRLRGWQIARHLTERSALINNNLITPLIIRPKILHALMYKHNNSVPMMIPCIVEDVDDIQIDDKYRPYFPYIIHGLFEMFTKLELSDYQITYSIHKQEYAPMLVNFEKIDDINSPYRACFYKKWRVIKNNEVGNIAFSITYPFNETHEQHEGYIVVAIQPTQPQYANTSYKPNIFIEKIGKCIFDNDESRHIITELKDFVAIDKKLNMTNDIDPDLVHTPKAPICISDTAFFKKIHTDEKGRKYIYHKDINYSNILDISQNRFIDSETDSLFEIILNIVYPPIYYSSPHIY